MDMVKGVANVVHAASPLMLNEDGKTSRDKGIFVSGSESSFQNFSLNPMYAMAKHAANGAAYSYADRLRPHGIRIVSVSFALKRESV
jgi:NAD(P)-dependent dehydrogenase (short-subunit alcohol dehydrogenase family)